MCYLCNSKSDHSRAYYLEGRMIKSATPASSENSAKEEELVEMHIFCSGQPEPRTICERRKMDDDVTQPKFYNVREELRSTARLSNSARIASTELLTGLKTMSDRSTSPSSEHNTSRLEQTTDRANKNLASCITAEGNQDASCDHGPESSYGLTALTRYDSQAQASDSTASGLFEDKQKPLVAGTTSPIVSLDERYLPDTLDCIQPLQSSTCSNPESHNSSVKQYFTGTDNPIKPESNKESADFGRLRGGADTENAPRIPRGLWYLAGNRLISKGHAPTIAQYNASQKILAENKKKWAEDIAKEVLAKANRKNEANRGRELLRQKGGMLGIAFGQVRGGGNEEPEEHRNDDRPRRTINPQERVPGHLWRLTGGRGPPPTVEAYNKKYRQSKKIGRNGEPGQLGGVMGVGNWGVADEGTPAKSRGNFWTSLKSLFRRE